MTSPTSLPIHSTVRPQGGYFAKTCERAIWNANNPTIPDELQVELSEAVRLRMDKGNAFEAEIEAELMDRVPGTSAPESSTEPDHAAFAALDAVGATRWGQRDGHSVVVAAFLVGDRTEESKRAREFASLEAMRLGIELVWNARFPADLVTRRVGEPDFLVRGPKLATGRYAYVPGDVKDHRALEGSAKPKNVAVCDLDALGLDAASTRQLGPGNYRKVDALQLAHYTFQLRALGHAMVEGEERGLLIGRERSALVYDLAAPLWRTKQDEATTVTLSTLAYYERAWDARMAIAEIAVTDRLDAPVAAAAAPTKRTECGECSWSRVCDLARRLGDDVSRVIGVSEEQAKLHRSRGTNTAAALARLDAPTAAVVDAGYDASGLIAIAARYAPDAPVDQVLADAAVLNRSRKEARELLPATLERFGVTRAADLAGLCPVTASYAGSAASRLLEQVDRARVLTTGRPHRSRGSQHVPVPRATIELHVDIEDAEGFIYLIGVKAFGRATPGSGRERRRSEYHPFLTWETTPEAEAQVLADWWDYVTGMQAYARSNKYALRAYCYTGHERSSLLRKAAEHAVHPGVPTVAELTTFFDSEHWVDVHAVLKADVVTPTEDVTLKTIATKLCGFVWRDEDPSGGNSMAWYRTAIDADADEDERAAARERILAYNEDDCHATYAICEWLSANGQARRPGATLPGVEQLDALFAPLRHPVPADEAAEGDQQVA
jgi:predicted RecB family nuclease